ncbi:hypothetical protein FGG08_005696 [Glutinoglossum americanum]|uniref:Spherulin 4-like cell surface protein n=1 Tax=Glutinoglossum americanum TaxID=1670608 RepID=A0A9P8KVS7_9PEZI|nr:hypothetical protein FGG08_005696 [Glutinoglossum americanum]
MEAIKSVRHRTRRFKLFSIAAVLAFTILAAAIPLAVVFTKRNHQTTPKPTVLVPLYVYPAPGAWDPLHQVVTANPGLGFTVVLNPANGPGPSQYPGSDYAAEVQKLNAHSNVRMMGYVPTGYATRNITSVLLDVSTYSGWATDPTTTGLAVHGIFFDETPNQYSTEAAEYLETINRAVKNSSGLLSDRMTIHNPGSIPDARLADPGPDVTVVFEETYQTYQLAPSSKTLQDKLASLPYGRSRYCYLMHSVPKSMGGADLRRLVDGLSKYAGYLFLTDLSDNYYASFGSKWLDFIDAMLV